jgi:hypothetical protein
LQKNGLNGSTRHRALWSDLSLILAAFQQRSTSKPSSSTQRSRRTPFWDLLPIYFFRALPFVSWRNMYIWDIDYSVNWSLFFWVSVLLFVL